MYMVVFIALLRRRTVVSYSEELLFFVYANIYLCLLTYIDPTTVVIAI